MSKPKKYDQYYTHDKPVQCKQQGFEHRVICQGCLEEGHVQLPSSEAFDCKMVFVGEDNKQHGQCCCYSKEHGLRKEVKYD